MTLSEDRASFSRFIAMLLTYGQQKGYRLALDEGRVFQTREGIANGRLQEFSDRVHLPNSKHYAGLAVDLVAWHQDGSPISDGTDPIWKDLGTYWTGLHPSCTWGGNFSKPDFDHFSWGER